MLLFTSSTILRAVSSAESLRVLTSGRLLATVALQLTLTALLLPLLMTRGWTLARLTAPPEPRDAIAGIWVLLLSWMALFTAALIAQGVVGPAAFRRMVQARITVTGPVPLRIAAAVIDPVFEELLFVAYPVVALRRWRTPMVAVLSVALRVVGHLYQGARAFVSILPLGLVFVAYYLRTRRLWPIVAAHTMQDILAMLSLGPT